MKICQTKFRLGVVNVLISRMKWAMSPYQVEGSFFKIKDFLPSMIILVNRLVISKEMLTFALRFNSVMR